MIYYNILIIIVIILVLYFNKTNNIKKIELKDNYITIQDNILKLIHKQSNGLYSSFNIKTYETEVGYFNKIYNNINKESNVKNILVLGFGLGAIALKLSLNKKIERIDCVDFDKELFVVFKKLFPKYSNKIKLYHNDASKYLENTKIKYDIIIDDVFDGYNKIELNYIKLKDCLKPNGKLYLNHINSLNRNINIKNKLLKLFNNSKNDKIKFYQQSLYIFQ